MTHEIQAQISSFEMSRVGLTVECSFTKKIWYRDEEKPSEYHDRVQIQLPESELPGLHIGQPITITFKTEEK